MSDHGKTIMTDRDLANGATAHVHTFYTAAGGCRSRSCRTSGGWRQAHAHGRRSHGGHVHGVLLRFN
jgi:hypothetical protein